jgi:hypothetical protein
MLWFSLLPWSPCFWEVYRYTGCHCISQRGALRVWCQLAKQTYFDPSVQLEWVDLYKYSYRVDHFSTSHHISDLCYRTRDTKTLQQYFPQKWKWLLSLNFSPIHKPWPYHVIPNDSVFLQIQIFLSNYHKGYWLVPCSPSQVSDYHMQDKHKCHLSWR